MKLEIWWNCLRTIQSMTFHLVWILERDAMSSDVMWRHVMWRHVIRCDVTWPDVTPDSSDASTFTPRRNCLRRWFWVNDEKHFCPDWISKKKNWLLLTNVKNEAEKKQQVFNQTFLFFLNLFLLIRQKSFSHDHKRSFSGHYFVSLAE